MYAILDVNRHIFFIIAFALSRLKYVGFYVIISLVFSSAAAKPRPLHIAARFVLSKHPAKRS